MGFNAVSSDVMIQRLCIESQLRAWTSLPSNLTLFRQQGFETGTIAGDYEVPKYKKGGFEGAWFWGGWRNAVHPVF